MVGDSVFVLVAVLALCLGAFTRPERAQCPPAFFVEGVRPSGVTQCLPFPAPSPSCRGAAPCPEGPPPRVQLPMRVYCEPGELAIVTDYRSIGCMRRAGS